VADGTCFRSAKGGGPEGGRKTRLKWCRGGLKKKRSGQTQTPPPPPLPTPNPANLGGPRACLGTACTGAVGDRGMDGRVEWSRRSGWPGKRYRRGAPGGAGRVQGLCKKNTGPARKARKSQTDSLGTLVCREKNSRRPSNRCRASGPGEKENAAGRAFIWGKNGQWSSTRTEKSKAAPLTKMRDGLHDSTTKNEEEK